MKKQLRFLICLSLCGALFSSCFDEKDFEIDDKFTTSDLNPTLYIPLLTDTLRVEDVGDEIQYVNGKACYVFNIGDIHMPSMNDLVSMPNQSLVNKSQTTPPFLSGQAFTYPTTANPMLTSDGNLDFGSSSPADMRVDSVVFTSLSLKISALPLNSGKFYLEIPNLKKGNSYYKDSILIKNTGIDPINLSGYSMKVDHGSGSQNLLTLNYRFVNVKAASNGNAINIQISFETIAIGEAYGYFGQYEEEVQESVSTEALNDLDATWDLKEAYLAMEVSNSMVMPISAALTKVTSYPKGGGAPIVVYNIDSMDIAAASKLNNPTITKDTLGGTSLADLVNVLPSQLDVNLNIKTNPAGNTGGTVKNAVNMSDITAKAQIIIPLIIRNTSITVTDTLDFDMSDISLSNMALKVYAQNSFPVSLKMQCTLLEKETGFVLGALFEAPIDIPSASTKTVSGNENEVDKPSNFEKNITISKQAAGWVQQSDRVIVNFVAATGNTNNNYVRITDKNYVHFKIGVSAAVTLDIK